MAIQHIYGCVNPDGSVKWGEGFRCQKLGEGTYMVQFEHPFSKQPTPTCTIFGPPWATFNISAALVEVTADQFFCLTSTPMQPANCGFTFVVLGEA